MTVASPRLPRYAPPLVGPTIVTVGTGFTQRVERSGQFAVFEFVFDENRHALSRQRRRVGHEDPPRGFLQAWNPCEMRTFDRVMQSPKRMKT